MSKHSNSILSSINYRVPSYANRILYMFGGISAIAFLTLILSGIYLSQFYSPTPETAHSTLVNSINNVPLVDFMRSLHFWVANLVVVLLILHIARVFITGSYKKPRRATWLTGVLLLMVTVFFIFIGTVLKWDQEGVEALVHAQESVKLFGIHIGLTNAGIPIITQLYTWHTTILTLLFLLLIALHMVLIKTRGISSRPVKGEVSSVTANTGNSTFMVHLKRLTGFGLLFIALSGLLAITFPAPIGFEGVLGQEVTRPLWMFWPFYGLENIFGLKALIWGMFVFFALLAIVPFIDRSPYVHWQKRKLILTLGLVFAVATISLGVYSRLQPAQSHIHEGGGHAHSSTVEENSDHHDDDAAEATADEFKLSHDRLRSEALFLIPASIALGIAGVWLAFSIKD